MHPEPVHAGVDRVAVVVQDLELDETAWQFNRLFIIVLFELTLSAELYIIVGLSCGNSQLGFTQPIADCFYQALLQVPWEIPYMTIFQKFVEQRSIAELLP